MKEQSLANIEARVRRVERQNRILVALLGISLAISSIAVSNAQPTVITAQEVRAHRFTLLDPNGGIASDWYTKPTPDGGREGGNFRSGAPYSNWAFEKP
jgi:hypothetical protein